MPTAINNIITPSSTDIVGRIYYNISKDNHITNDSIDSKKRPRSWESEAAAAGSQRGFIFIPNKTTQLALSTIYPQYKGHELFHIVIPYQFLRIACHAVSSGENVRISQYSLIQYMNGWGELISPSSNNGKTSTDIEVIQSTTTNKSNSFITIEVHQNGFGLVSSSDCSEEEEEEETNMQDDLPTLTLDELSQKEWESTLLSSTTSSGSKSKKRKSITKDPMNVTAVVDAISPILVNDSSNEEPFAIIELYQLLPNNNDVKSAVAIIRGEQALCMHPAIHPGQSITLMGVVSRKWRVPEVLRQKYYSNTADEDGMDKRSDLYTRLEHRVPDRVLVVTEASSIRWNVKYGMTKRLDDISLPSTVQPLTSIRGIVKYVHYHLKQSKNGKKKSTHVAHFVTLKPLSLTKDTNLEEKMIRIYLPKYPLPPNLLIGLQTGCIIRAVNVHHIHPMSNTAKCEHTNQVDENFQCYVACLRSTIAIERCAGENYHRLSSHPRFVPPKGKAFSMVPDHHITDICSDPFGTKSPEQYFVEEKLRCELESKLGDDESNSQDGTTSAHSASTKIDVLLEHHHITATLGMSRSNHVNGRSHTKRSSNKVNNGEHGRQSARDPYAEFFDHAHNKAVSHDTECGSSCNKFSHYNHFYNSTPTSVPLVVGLEDLRNACAHNFVNRIRISLQSKQGRAGQTSSHHFRGLNLCQVLNDYSQSQSTSNGQAKTWYDVSNESTPNFYVCGIVEQVRDMDSDSEISSTSFSDKSCTIPVCEPQKPTTNGCHFEVNGSSWININSIVVSCLCLGSSKKEYEVTESEDSYMQQSSITHTHTFLPAKKLDGTDNSKMASDTSGHVFMFTADNLAFIASVHLTVKSFVSMDLSNFHEAKADALKTLSKPRESTEHTSNHTSDLMSVQECLEQTTLISNSLSEKPISIIGRLVRKRFGFRKLKQNCYEGWSIVISHIDHQSAGHVLNIASVLQTIEVRISVPLNNTQATGSETLKLALNRLSSNSITPDQVTMGLAFWSASESSRTLPLLSGGWDEGGGLLADQNTIQPSIFLEIPYTSSRHFAKLGYQRFRCNLNGMKSYFVYSETRLSNSGVNEHSVEFGTGKFLPGMLTRRLRRIPPLKFKIPEANDSTLHCRNSHSPLISLKYNGGVPSVTLAQLHWDICAALKEGNHAYLKPSLLRRIHNPKILGISFCRARVECTQCFQALSRSTASSKGAHQNTMSSPFNIKPHLSCPSGCSLLHAAVKWECSAIIDDSTGQAKLYAERESALLLLGSSLDVATIENGAWELNDGVFFQPALPASSHLMQCIKDATIKARRCIAEIKLNKKKDKKEENLPTTFSLLPADAKAEYLLHQHCRQWYQNHHQRKLDLFCRCKPLSENATSVNQTQIQVAKAQSKLGLDFGTVSSATLPPLKLTLEDSCLTSEDSQEDNISGWDHLRSSYTS